MTLVPRILTGVLLVFFALAVGDHLAAQSQTFHVDPAKSEVHFGLGDPLHAVNGTFRVEKGEFSFDPRGNTMGGTIAVDAASGQSGNTKRDSKMASDELKADSFRSVTFSPKRFTGTLAPAGDSTITVEGTFTLLGTPHPITVPLQVHRESAVCTATGSFLVPYVQWGLKDPSIFVLRVGKEVTIKLLLVGSIR